MSQEILEAIERLNSRIREHADEVKAGQRNRDEEVAKIKTTVDEIGTALREQRHALPSNAPVPSEMGYAMATPGGWKSLGLRKALEIPANHATLRPEERADLQLLQDAHDACALKFQQLKKRHDETTAWRKLASNVDFKMYVRLLDAHGIVKANEIMHPDNTVFGTDKLDFTLLSSSLIEKMRLDLVVASQFTQLPLTRSSQKFPTQLTDGKGVLGGSAATAPPPKDAITSPFPPSTHMTAPTFGERQFDVKHLLAYLWWNDDMMEDSIIPWLPMMRNQAAYSAARALDDAILNGDTTATHMDTDTTAAYDFRKAFYGLRKMGKNNWKSNSGNALDSDDVHTLRASLGIYGLNVARLRMFVSIKDYYALVADTNSKLVSTAGQQASLLTGTILPPWGIPTLISEWARTDTDNTGVNGASGNTLSVVSICNIDRFVVAMYGTSAVEEWRVPPVLTTVIQSDQRVDFGPWDERTLTNGMWASSSTNLPANTLYNIG